MSLEDRVLALERTAKRWRRAAVVLGVVVLVTGTVAASQEEEPTKLIRARRFEVINERGVPVVAMTSDKRNDSGIVVVSNSKRRPIVGLTPGPQGQGGLIVYNERRRNVVTITAANGHGVMLLGSDSDKRVVSLGVDRSGNGFLTLDHNKEDEVALGSGSITIGNKPSVVLDVDDGDGTVLLRGRTGAPAVMLNAMKGSGEVIVFDAKGNQSKLAREK